MQKMPLKAIMLLMKQERITKRNLFGMHPQKVKQWMQFLQESDNFQNAGDDDLTEVEWEKVDINSSSIRFVFKNQIDSPGPITLQSNNWQNIDVSPTLKANEKIEFKKLDCFHPRYIRNNFNIINLGGC